MNKYILIGLLAVTMSACSKDDKKDGGATHNPKECPADIAGTYMTDFSPEPITIRIENGLIIIHDPSSGDLPVNGSVVVDKANGSSNSIVCKGGNLLMTSVDKDGTKVLITVSKDGKDLNGTRSDGEKFKMTRTGEAVAPAPDVKGKPVDPNVTPDPNAMPQMPDMPDWQDMFNNPGVQGVPQMPATPVAPKPSPEVVNECGNGNSCSYTFSVNGCTTGQQIFCSKQEYCDGLKNETLNNSCALMTRMQKYQEACN